LFQACRHGADGGVKGSGGSRFGNIGLLRNVFYQFGFIQG
jgi:hypothetical protein